MNKNHHNASHRHPHASAPAAAAAPPKNNVQQRCSPKATTQQQQQQQRHPQATLEMCLLCFDVLLLKLHQRSQGIYTADLLSGMPTFTDAVLSQVSCPLFVTWNILAKRGHSGNTGVE